MPDPTPPTPSTPPAASAPAAPASVPSEPPIRTPSNKEKAWDIFAKVMIAAVLPLAGWGINLHATQKTLDLRIQQLEADIADNKADIKELKPHATALARLDEQMKAMNSTLTEIKAILNRPPIR